MKKITINKKYQFIFGKVFMLYFIIYAIASICFMVLNYDSIPLFDIIVVGVIGGILTYLFIASIIRKIKHTDFELTEEELSDETSDKDEIDILIEKSLKKETLDPNSLVEDDFEVEDPNKIRRDKILHSLLLLVFLVVGVVMLYFGCKEIISYNSADYIKTEATIIGYSANPEENLSQSVYHFFDLDGNEYFAESKIEIASMPFLKAGNKVNIYYLKADPNTIHTMAEPLIILTIGSLFTVLSIIFFLNQFESTKKIKLMPLFVGLVFLSIPALTFTIFKLISGASLASVLFGSFISYLLGIFSSFGILILVGGTIDIMKNRGVMEDE